MLITPHQVKTLFKALESEQCTSNIYTPGEVALLHLEQHQEWEGYIYFQKDGEPGSGSLVRPDGERTVDHPWSADENWERTPEVVCVNMRQLAMLRTYLVSRDQVEFRRWSNRAPVDDLLVGDNQRSVLVDSGGNYDPFRDHPPMPDLPRDEDDTTMVTLTLESILAIASEAMTHLKNDEDTAKYQVRNGKVVHIIYPA